jgi:hypothetical protein
MLSPETPPAHRLPANGGKCDRKWAPCRGGGQSHKLSLLSGVMQRTLRSTVAPFLVKGSDSWTIEDAWRKGEVKVDTAEEMTVSGPSLLASDSPAFTYLAMAVALPTINHRLRASCTCLSQPPRTGKLHRAQRTELARAQAQVQHRCSSRMAMRSSERSRRRI